MGVSVCENVRVGMGMTLCTVSMQVPAVCMKMGESERVFEREGLQGDVGPGVGKPRPRVGTELKGCPFQQVLEGQEGQAAAPGAPRPLSQAGQGSDG